MNKKWYKKLKISGYLFIAPNIMGISFFFLFPAVYSLWLSFTDWKFGYPEKEFVGLENFITLFQDDAFYVALWNTIKFLLAVPISMALAFLVAMVVNDKVFFKKTLRAMFFIPYITSGIAIAFVWMLLFHPQKGPINQALINLGVSEPPAWLSASSTSMYAIDIIWIWFLLGYNMIIYLAALQNVPTELIEAAKIDGAKPWDRVRHIILPLVSPTTLFLLITGFIMTIKHFGIIQAVTGGGPGDSTTVLSLFVYTTAFRYYDIGYASAISWILFMLVLFLTFGQWLMQKKWVHY